MNASIQLKPTTSSLFIAFVLLCVGFLPTAQAVVPPPDGGYPGFNTAEGQNALFNLTTGVANTGNGWFSLFSNTDGSYNTAVGAGTLLFNVGNQSTGQGVENTALGTAVLLFNDTGFRNTAVGVAALLNNTHGSQNTANGYSALSSNTLGGGNTAIGSHVLVDNTTGGANTAIGGFALHNNTTGVNNTALGVNAGLNVTTADNVICVGATGQNVDNGCYVGNIFGEVTGFGTQVFVNSAHKLGTVSSSKRFKEEIRSMEQASETLFALRPVTFRYKNEVDPQGILQFGLLAEDVQKVNPDLIVRDKNGKPYSVRYDQVNAMLLNEFLKTHKAFLKEKRKVRKLEANAERQQRQIEALTAVLQKVSAQLELSKPAPQTAENNQ